MSQIPASLIICSAGRSAMLLEVVQQILAGSLLPTEMIVIEDAKVGESSLASFTTDACSYRYVGVSTVTLSEKRNLGISIAQNELIVFADDDVSIPSTWFESIARTATAMGDRRIVTGRVVSGVPECPGAYAPSLHPSSDRAVYHRRSTFEDPLATFNCAFYKIVPRTIGGFDVRLGPGTRYPACEDNDFGLRALEAGFEIAFEPRALLYHRAWRRPETFVALRHTYGRGQGAFYAKHLKRDRYIWRKFSAALIRHGRRAMVRDTRESLGELAWFAGLARGLAGWRFANIRRSERGRGRSRRTRPNRFTD